MKKVLLICIICFFAVTIIFPEQVYSEDSITFWTFLEHNRESPRSRVQTDLIEEFEEKYGVTVNVDVIYWADIPSRIISAVDAGEGPDVTRIAIDMLLQQFGADTLYPLDEFTEQWTDEEIDDWALDWEEGTKDGQKMALWIEHRVGTMFYRPSYLDEIDEDIPRTWDDVGRVGNKLAEQGLVGFSVGLSHSGLGNGFMEWFRPAIWAAGGDLIDDEGMAIFNDSAGVKAMETLYDLVYEYNAIPTATLSWDIDQMFFAFEAGRLGMMSFGSHRAFTAMESETVGDDFATAPIPSFSEDEYGESWVGGWKLAMTKDVGNKDLAWKFIEHMTSTDAHLMGAKIAGEVPPRKSAFEDPWFEETTEGQLMLEWMDYINDHGKAALYPEDNAFLHEVLVDAAQQIILQDRPAQEALDEAAQRYNADK